MIPAVLAPKPSKSFNDGLHSVDKNLKAVFNCETERWEIYRFAKNKWNWIIAVENEDGSYRPLDFRIFYKLREIDIISKWGSIDNYERHLDEKQKKYREDCEKEMNHEFKCDVKDDKVLWRRAVENFQSGILDNPPEEPSKKVMSYSK